MKVDKISLFLEIDGKPHVALLEDENKDLIVDVLASVCKNGILRVTKLPDDFKFEPLSQHLTTASN
jgi:hypothetical protein